MRVNWFIDKALSEIQLSITCDYLGDNWKEVFRATHYVCIHDGLHVNQVQMTPETPLLKRITKQNVGGAGIFGVACTTKSEEKLPERSATRAHSYVEYKKNYSADETRSNLS